MMNYNEKFKEEIKLRKVTKYKICQESELAQVTVKNILEKKNVYIDSIVRMAHVMGLKEVTINIDDCSHFLNEI